MEFFWHFLVCEESNLHNPRWPPPQVIKAFKFSMEDLLSFRRNFHTTTLDLVLDLNTLFNFWFILMKNNASLNLVCENEWTLYEAEGRLISLDLNNIKKDSFIGLVM